MQLVPKVPMINVVLRSKHVDPICRLIVADDENPATLQIWIAEGGE